MENYEIIEFGEKNLTEILSDDYSGIFAEMKKEDYILEYESFYQFWELKYEGNTAGFLTLDTFLPDDVCLCLNECYILPQYRGKGILIDIIKELLRNEEIRFYIRKPNYSFIKFLLKHGLALEITSDIVASHIKIVVRGSERYTNKNIKRLYRKLTEQSSELICYAKGFNMKLCSIFLSDHTGMIAKKDNILTFANPRKEDLKKHDCRKKLDSLTLGRMNDIQHDYAINIDKIEEFDKNLSLKLNENNDDVLVYRDEKGNFIVNKNLKPNDLLIILDVVAGEIKKGNLSNSSAKLRIDYLLENPDEIGKSVDLSEIDHDQKDIINCPFCGQYCSSGDKICKTCGQKVKSLFAKDDTHSFKNIFKNFREMREKGYIGNILEDRVYDRAVRKKYNLSDVEIAQKKIADYEIVKYISQNRIYFNPPSFGCIYHHLKDSFDDDRACEEGYLRKITDEEFISRVQNEYTYDQLVSEVEVEGMTFEGEELEKHISNLKNYTKEWVRDVYEPTDKGLAFIKSSKSMEIFSKYLRGFIYYEFEKYYLKNKDKSDIEICEGFVKNQYREVSGTELVYYYRNYLWYKCRLYSYNDDFEKSTIKILQLAIFEVNRYYLKNKRNYLMFINDLGELLKTLDESDVDKYYDEAFDEFKLELFKNHKKEAKEYILTFLKGNDAYIS